MNHGEVSPRLITHRPASARDRGSDRMNMGMRVRAGRRLDAPFGGFLEATKPHMRQGKGTERAEQQGIEWA